MSKKTKFPQAQSFLESAEMIDAIANNKLIERQQWRELALKITAQMDGERVQASSSADKMASALNRCLDAEGEIDDAIAKLRVQKKQVTDAIERLDNPTEYKMMHLRYIQYIPLVDIADMWGVPCTNITTMHGRALKKIERIRHEICTSC